MLMTKLAVMMLITGECGHGHLRAAAQLGHQPVPVHPQHAAGETAGGERATLEAVSVETD